MFRCPIKLGTGTFLLKYVFVKSSLVCVTICKPVKDLVDNKLKLCCMRSKQPLYTRCTYIGIEVVYCDAPIVLNLLQVNANYIRHCYSNIFCIRYRIR